MNAHNWLPSVADDARHAVRSLRRSSTFTIVAVLTLALGVAASTAMFSAVNAALLRPLPYPRSNELVDVRTRLVDGRVTTGLVSPAEMGLLAETPSLVAGVAGYTARAVDSALVSDDGTPVGLAMYGVTEGFFEILGVPMRLGRPFTHEEHVPGGRDAPVSVVLSDGAWTRLFGRDPAIIGKTIHVAEMTGVTTIVGVASPLVDVPHAADVWFNSRIPPQQVVHVLNVVARLQPHATLEQLRAAGGAKLYQFGRTDASADGREWVLQPLVTSLAGDLRPVLWIVLGATLLLLALACVNVTNLLLARGMARTSEMALRTALGAGRGRIVRQLLTESMVLAAAGAAVGFMIAAIAIRGLVALGGSMLPRLESIPMDARVLFFGAAVLVASGLIVGLIPAWRLARADVRTLLNESSRSASSGAATSRVMASLIVAEIALAIAVVAGAGWLVQSFSRLRNVDPGFVADGRLIVDVRATRVFTDPVAADAWSLALINRVRAVTGAEVGAGATVPLRGDVIFTQNVELEGEPSDPSRSRGAFFRIATPGYFEALGIRLVAGRRFTDDDRRTSERVVIVNRAFVRQYYPDRDPLRGAFASGYPIVDRKTMARIVGVVEDVRFTSLTQPDEATYYLPSSQAGVAAAPNYMVRFPMVHPAIVVAVPTGSAAALIAPLRKELRSFDPSLLVTFTAAEAIVTASTARQSLGMMLMLIFGALALTLAAIGIYGVIAYTVEERRMELATRLALGAPPGHVFQLMLSTAQRLSMVGLLLGVTMAYAGGRLLTAHVYAVSAADPSVLIAAGVAVTAVAVAATLIPAMRASRLNPVCALRPH